MKQKRILAISYHTCPLASEEGKETGGMNVYVLELSKELARLGHHVDVFTRCQGKNNKTTVAVTPGFRVIHLVAGPCKTINKKILPIYIPEFVESALRFIEKEHLSYDILHAHYYQSGIIGMDINKKLPSPLPFVMSFHTLALMKNLVARSTSEQENRTRIDAEYRLTRKADAIITSSFSDKQYIKYLYNGTDKNIFEVPPGVNLNLFKSLDKSRAKKHIGIPEKTKLIIFVGRIEPLKGIDMLLYALKILIRENPLVPIKLVIVGGDISQHVKKWSSPLKQLEQLRRTLGLSDYVQFVGQKPQYELPYYYNASELVVMPSHYESFGLSAAEAMACGIPVITTNVAGISDLIDEKRAALITTVNNPLLLASQIKKLLTNKDLYHEVKKSISQNTQDLNWNTVAKQIDKVYDRIIDHI